MLRARNAQPSGAGAEAHPLEPGDVNRQASETMVSVSECLLIVRLGLVASAGRRDQDSAPDRASTQIFFLSSTYAR